MSEQTGLHTQFLRGDGGTPETFEEIAYVAAITPPALQRDTVEVDDLNPANDVKKKLVGLIDPGELTLTLNFVPGDDGVAALEQDLADALPCNYRIQFPLGEDETAPGYCTIGGLVTGFAIQEITAGDVIQAEVTIAAVTKPVFIDPVKKQ